ncbi:MAG: Na/Pi cotransporter family protein [Eubacterium sp.]|nr:Na/Pi cotransporter family protein [Eubacterium sp.]
MGITMVLSLLSGVALFLFGMSLMGDGLKRVAGNKLELTLYRLTNTPFKGVLLGMVVTAIIQSSSATTVMVVGFVNSGMMQVSQAIGIIMGANIGTSITGWVLCLSYVEGSAGIAQLLSTATISSVVAIVGIIFKTFVKKESYKSLGEIMLGFSILMLGMQTMSGAVSPLKESERFIRALTMFSNPAAGIVAGILLTAVLQSASASVGILQALSATGAIHFATALPITMGIGVGASCPVILSSIGTNKNGKRTALVYLLIDSFGMVVWSILFYSVNAFVDFPFMDTVMGPVQIAMLNTVFRSINISLLLPLIKWIEKFVFWAVRDEIEEEDKDKEERADFELLEERFLAYPAIAISQSHRAMNGMARKARKNILRAFALMDSYSKEKYQKIQEKEILIDTYEDRLGTYLMQLTGKEMNAAQNKEMSKFLHTIGDFERLGDHAVNISEAAEELYEKKLSFSEEAQYELNVLEKAVQEILDLTVNAFCENDLETSVKVEPLRELISVMCDELKLRHIARLKDGDCKLKQSFVFNDLLNNLERIAAHCSNVAVAMIELEAEEFDTHEYLRSVKGLKNANYSRQLEIYENKYDIKRNKKSKKKAVAR